MRKNNGKKAHALLMAPNPDKSPSIMVPSTTSRDKAVVVRLDDARASGRGIHDSKNRYMLTGIKLPTARNIMKRLRD